MKSKYNFIVTGATGFIGKRFVKELIRKNIHENIYCFVRKSSNIRELEELSVIIVTVDFNNPETMNEYFKKADYVFHFAALTQAQKEDELIKANVDITKIMYGLFSENRNTIKRFFL